MHWLLGTPSDSDFAHIKNTPLSALVRDRLLSQILSGTLMPGQALREIDLAADMQVSRVPVREALKELENIGLVVARKHVGVFVRELTDTEVEDLYALRALLDTYGAKAAFALPADARRALGNKLRLCTERMDEYIAAENGTAYYQENLRFHWLFIENAGNSEVAKTYKEVIQKLHLHRLRNLASTEQRKVSNAEHRQIVRALDKPAADMGGDGFADLLSHHVLHSYRRLTGQSD